jgi:hypothetical protein|tara:strand:+ start:665 stop:853 length:189 start_codon:yes stop_codon:yes gene_type:complete
MDEAGYTPMSPSRALDEMWALEKSRDAEDSHSKADELLCSVCIWHGHTDLVDSFRKLRKYYA